MKFELIKKEYNKLHKQFLTKNSILVKYLDHGVWAPSIPKELFKIFKKYEDKRKTFLDLGSGDGIVVMIASLFFKEAHGIEIDENFYKKSIEMKEKLVANNVEFHMENYFDHDFSQYDIIFIAPDKEFTLKLENKISKELKGIFIVYSSIFQPKTLRKIDQFDTNYFTVCVYENKPK